MSKLLTLSRYKITSLTFIMYIFFSWKFQINGSFFIYTYLQNKISFMCFMDVFLTSLTILNLKNIANKLQTTVSYYLQFQCSFRLFNYRIKKFEKISKKKSKKTGFELLTKRLQGQVHNLSSTND